jgi:hypothetical protein
VSRSVGNQRAFTAGEVSPNVYARDDLALYESGAARIENFIVMPTGGLDPRAGTRFVNAAHDETKIGRLKKFQFKRADSHMLEFGHLAIRIYRNGALVLDGGVPVVVVSPYTEAELPDLQFVQTADELFIVHENHPRMKLQRHSLTNWTLVAAPTKNGPFRSENSDRTVTVRVTGDPAGAVTLHASSAIFDAGMVGSPFRLTEVDQSLVPAWEGPPTGWDTGQRVRIQGRVYEQIASPANDDEHGSNPPTQVEGDWSAGTKVVWRYIHNGSGIVNLTGFTSTTEMTGTVDTSQKNRELPEGVMDPKSTYRWSEGAYSARRGYPGVIGFFEQRFVLARTGGDPLRFDLSKSGDNSDFATGDHDDDAISYSIAHPDLSAIQWVAAAGALAFGTLGPVFLARGATETEALSATNISVRPQVSEGAAPVLPVGTGGEILFVERTGKALCELVFDFQKNAYTAPDNTVRADHIAGSGFAELAFQQKPYRVVWARREDGELTGFTYLPDQEVRAWHRHPLRAQPDGTRDTVEAIETKPADDGKTDELWLLTRRVVAGEVRRFVEVLQAPFSGLGVTDARAAWFFDCALGYDGAATATLDGLDHLEGETVAVWADGALHPDCTVTGGEITLNRPCSRVVAGLDFNAEVESLDAYQGLADGSGRTRERNVTGVVLHVRDAIGGEVSVDGGANFEPVFQSGASGPLGAGPALQQGAKRLAILGGEETGARWIVRRSKGGPLRLLAVRPIYNVGEVR